MKCHDFHIQINIFGDAIDDIVENNISLDQVLKSNGIYNFVILEIPHNQNHNYSKVYHEHFDQSSFSGINTPIENRLSPQNTKSWQCSTPLYSPHHAPRFDISFVRNNNDLRIAENKESYYMSRNHSQDTVKDIMKNIVSRIEQDEKQIAGSNMKIPHSSTKGLIDCSLFTDTIQISNFDLGKSLENGMDSSAGDYICDLETTEFLDKNLDVSFQSCVSSQTDVHSSSCIDDQSLLNENPDEECNNLNTKKCAEPVKAGTICSVNEELKEKPENKKQTKCTDSSESLSSLSSLPNLRKRQKKSYCEKKCSKPKNPESNPFVMKKISESQNSEQISRVDVKNSITKVVCKYPNCNKSVSYSLKAGTFRLAEHIRSHLDRPSRYCTHCKSRFYNVYLLRRHHYRMHKNMLYTCPETNISDEIKLKSLVPICFPDHVHLRIHFKRLRHATHSGSTA